MSSVAAKAQQVLDFWFGQPGSAGWDTARSLWFVKSDATDEAIRSQFLPLWQAARDGACDDWMNNPLGACARIVLFDQFPRNMFRDQSEAFSTDALALETAVQVVARGWDRQLPTAHHRSFCYLPFEHSEDRVSQQFSIALYTQLALETDLKDGLEWAEKHRVIIARFGRYPHRNAALGRVSTPEEEAFLKEPGSSF